MTTETERLEGDEMVTIDLPREELYALMMEAHRRDITLNQLVNIALREKMIAEGWDPETGEFKSND
jgi:hypothetical protein